MRERVFVRRSRIEASAAELFEWHARDGAFERLNPPWERAEVVERTGGLEGGRIELRIPAGPARLTWIAEHRGYVEGCQFQDVQVQGPFARWEHTHLVEPEGPEAAILTDRIVYALPAGLPGNLLGGPFVEEKLDRVFAYRHRITADDLRAHAPCRGGRAMKTVVTGANGLVGSSLVPFLRTGGHDVVRLVRKGARRAGDALWDPAKGEIDAAALEGAEAVVHLAGESIASGGWDAAKKERIRTSRVVPTRLLAETLAGLRHQPKVLVSASAVGYYGDRGEEGLNESAASSTDFLGRVCEEWEAATAAAEAAGIRVVRLRIGVVLSPEGGALAKMLPPFRLGAGGRLGTGRQWMSWIAIDDLLGAIHHAMIHPSLSGAVNAVSPEPATNQQFTKALGRVLGRPTLASVPAFAARLAFGEMADALLLASTRVHPAKLLAAGYAFRHPDLDDALRHALGRAAA